jgi:hypothetical protein
MSRNWEYRTENADHYVLVFPNRTISHGTVSRLSEDSEDKDLLHNSQLRGGALDERDSDSTHSVKSSTCQPASRYRVKSAELLRRSESRRTALLCILP